MSLILPVLPQPPTVVDDVGVAATRTATTRTRTTVTTAIPVVACLLLWRLKLDDVPCLRRKKEEDEDEDKEEEKQHDLVVTTIIVVSIAVVVDGCFRSAAVDG